MKKDLSKLSCEDKEKYLVFTRMEKAKIAMYIFLAIGALTFILGLILKEGFGWLMLTGAIGLTVFVVLAIAYVYIKSVWEKLMRESRKKSK